VARLERLELPGSGVHITRRLGDPPDNGHPIVLLHGLSGDETSLWVFESALPRRAVILSVRGIYPWPAGGFSWVAPGVDHRYSPQDFVAGVEAVEQAVRACLSDVERGRGIIFVGFSQGSGLAFAAAYDQRLPVAGIACLAGFLPDGPPERVSGLPVFWSHGRQDTLVPIEEAREEVERLRAAGARVTFCEANAGHKVDRACWQRLRTWLREEGLA
jgi:phospholipase/carboxylesterase